MSTLPCVCRLSPPTVAAAFRTEPVGPFRGASKPTPHELHTRILPPS